MGRTALSFVAALVACGGSPFVKPVADPDLPDWAPPATLAEGPLSLIEKMPDVPWPERQRWRGIRDEHYVGKDGIVEDATVFLRMVETFFVPRTRRQHDGLDVARRASTLHELAPYSLEGVLNAYRSYGERLDICVRAPHEVWHCDPSFVAPPPRSTAFEVSEAEPGIALLAIHDLSPAAEWTGFAPHVATLARAKAIVIDMRDAVGDDPRHLLPLLERLTGRAPLAPLAAIRRPPEADRYVSTYNAWYRSASRDRAVWQALVGTMPARAATAPAPPLITIVVGEHCGAACELAARVLVTYAGAKVMGNVSPRSGRMARDEPAMLRLPHSKLDVFFLATEYTLAAEIERATGLTAEWKLTDAHFDYLPFALREISARLRGGFTRCDALPAYKDPHALPFGVRSKLSYRAPGPGCSPSAVVYTDTRDVPFSALEWFASTCPGDLDLSFQGGAPGGWWIHPTLPFSVYARLAQSELVQWVKVTCEPPRQHLLLRR